nr:hypothetical protein [bacterium]
VWGRNAGDESEFDSYLVESSLKQDGSWSPYLRYEWVEKSAEELVLPSPQFDSHDEFAIQQATVGMTIDLGDKGDWQWGLGGAYVVSLSPNSLDPVYGSNPDGWNIYLRAHPLRMKHNGHDASSDPGIDHSDDGHLGENDHQISEFETSTRPNTSIDTSPGHGNHGDHAE